VGLKRDVLRRGGEERTKGLGEPFQTTTRCWGKMWWFLMTREKGKKSRIYSAKSNAGRATFI